MLRRRQDRGFELLLFGEAIQKARPAKVPPSSVAAVKLRVMASLGEQEGRARKAAAQTSRWIAIPAGIGLTAAVIAALRPSEQQSNVADQTPGARLSAGRILFEGNPILAALPGQRIVSDGNAWLVADDTRLGLESDSAVHFLDDLSTLVVDRGTLTVVAGGAFSLKGEGWSASLSPDTTARFESMPSLLLVSVFEGAVHLQADDSRSWVLRAGESGTVPFAPPRPASAALPPGRVGPATPLGSLGLPAGEPAPVPASAAVGAAPPSAGAPPTAGIASGYPAVTPPTASEPGGTAGSGAGAPAESPPAAPPAGGSTGAGAPPAAAGSPPTDHHGHEGNQPGSEPPPAAEGPPPDLPTPPPAEPGSAPPEPPAAPPTPGDTPGRSASAPGQNGSAPGLAGEAGPNGAGGPPANPGQGADNGNAPANPGQGAGNGKSHLEALAEAPDESKPDADRRTPESKDVSQPEPVHVDLPEDGRGVSASHRPADASARSAKHEPGGLDGARGPSAPNAASDSSRRR